jgi:hypothetical protein
LLDFFKYFDGTLLRLDPFPGGQLLGSTISLYCQRFVP